MIRIVLDANIVFRALAAGNADIASRFDAPRDAEFYSPFYLLAELFEHKEQIRNASKLDEQDVVDAFRRFIETITFVRESLIPFSAWLEAHHLCREVDPDDTPYIALTLHLGALFWTRDERLKDCLRTKGFTAFYEP
jgi:predicted nucleic acid-binding protein